MQTNYTGSVTAIAAILVTVLAKFGLNVQAGDIVTIIFGIIALAGIVKQMIDHKNVVAQVNSQS